MIVKIDFSKREVHFDDTTSLTEMASCMNNYFPEDVWGDFKFAIYAGVNENPNSDGQLHIPF